MLRFDEDADSLRLGAKHELTPAHTLLGSLILQDQTASLRAQDFYALLTTQNAFNVDVQEIFRTDGLTVQSGFVAAQSDDTAEITAFDPPGVVADVRSEDETNRQLGSTATSRSIRRRR